MSFENALVKAGYSKVLPTEGRYSWEIASFYKAITDSKGTKYQICGYQYPGTQNIRKESFTFKVKFEMKNGDSFEVETLQWFYEDNQWNHNVNTVESVEAFFDNIWKGSKCKHIDLYH